MLVTVEDLQNYMDLGKFSPRAKIGIEAILAGLQSELEAYLRRPLEVGTFTETYRFLEDASADVIPFYSNFGVQESTVTVNYPNRRTLAVRNSPIVSVSSVYVSRVGSASVALERDTDFGIRRFGIDIWNPTTDDEYTITYTAGLDGVNYPVFKLLILRAASREAQNMYDDNKGIQALEARESTIAQTGFTDAELASVKRYKRVRY